MIPPLPDPYVEHLVAPRGVGDVTLAMAAGEVGSMVGGSGVRVTLAWRDAGRGRAVVGEVLARTFGSHALVAPASMLTTLAQGLGEEEASGLSAAALVEGLGGPGLPAPVVRACESVAEAWLRALGVSPGAAPPIRWAWACWCAAAWGWATARSGWPCVRGRATPRRWAPAAAPGPAAAPAAATCWP